MIVIKYKFYVFIIIISYYVPSIANMVFTSERWKSYTARRHIIIDQRAANCGKRQRQMRTGSIVEFAEFDAASADATNATNDAGHSNQRNNKQNVQATLQATRTIK